MSANKTHVEHVNLSKRPLCDVISRRKIRYQFSNVPDCRKCKSMMTYKPWRDILGHVVDPLAPKRKNTLKGNVRDE